MLADQLVRGNLGCSTLAGLTELATVSSIPFGLVCSHGTHCVAGHAWHVNIQLAEHIVTVSVACKDGLVVDKDIVYQLFDLF